MQGITAFVCSIVDQIKTSSALRAAALPRQAMPGRESGPATAPAKAVSKNVSVTNARPVVQRTVIAACPACQKGGIIEGNRGFGCNRFREGCNYVVWKEFHGKKLSQAAIDALIAGKPTRSIKGFVLEDGSTVSGRLQMKEDRSGIELIIAEEKETKKKKQAD